MPRIFCVLSTQRSGSTWLMMQLAARQDIRAFGEVLLNRPITAATGNPEIQPPMRYCQYKSSRFIVSRPKFGQYVSYLSNTCTSESHMAFKVMYSQLSLGRLSVVSSHRWPIIHLVRENAMEVALSREVAKRTGTPHVRGVRPVVPPFSINVRYLFLQIIKIEMQISLMRRILRAMPNDVYEFSYEAMINEQAHELRKVLSFVGADTRKITNTTPLKKLSKSASTYLTNFEEVKDGLTRYGRGHYVVGLR